LYFVNPSFQKASIRITYVPIRGANDPIPEEVAGDMQSGVIELAGDKIVIFEIPFDKPLTHATVRTPFVNGTERNTNGSIVVQMVMPIVASGTAVPITMLVYAMAGEGFEMLQYKGPPPGVKPSYYSAPNVTLVRKATSWDLAKAPAMKFTEFTNRASIGFVAPDATHGPTTALKRPHSGAPYYSRDIRNPSGGQYEPLIANPDMTFDGSSPWSWFFHLFQGWSGSVVFNITHQPVSNARPVIGAVRGGSNLVASNLLDGTDHCGAALVQSNITPSITVIDPWMEPVIYTRVFLGAGDILRYSPYLYPWADNDDPLLVTVAAGDDFAFYHMVMTPAWVSNAPPEASRLGKKPSASLKA
jgi:hypothetical protein